MLSETTSYEPGVSCALLNWIFARLEYQWKSSTWSKEIVPVCLICSLLDIDLEQYDCMGDC